MKTKRLILSFLGLLLGMGLIFAIYADAENSAISHSPRALISSSEKPGTQPKHHTKALKGMLDKNYQTRYQEFKRQIINPHGVDLQNQEDSLTRQKHVFKISAHHYGKLYNSPFRHRLRTEILDELMQKPYAVQMAHKILTDNQLTRQTFEQDQAGARIMAIDLLQRLSEQGNITPLESTAADLTEKHAEAKTISRGQRADLSDLIIAYLNVMNPFSAMKHLPNVLERLGYKTELEDIYREAIWIALRNKVSRSDLHQYMKQTFEQFNG